MKLPFLPISIDFETKPILLQLTKSHRYLAELKGASASIPNQAILIQTLPLLEAKDSSAIENIITTHDELFKNVLFEDYIQNPATKEVQNYSIALRTGFELIKSKGFLSKNQIIEIHSIIENNHAGFRKLPGTNLKNDRTGEIIYIPPQHFHEIESLMDNLEGFINDDSQYSIDPLIKMAMIHYQFESIHPFYDGNGRTGRIINIIFLVLKGLLDIPILYLSRYIIKNKMDYYRLLQEVRTENKWEEWILFILKGVEETSIETLRLVRGIQELMADYKKRIKENYKFYSQDLLNQLFYYPYTKIEFLESNLRIHRHTARRYLDDLSQGGFLKKEKIGKSNFYINTPLFDLFRAS
jgi:Fic family protein